MRQIDEGDLPFLWAAYRLGALPDIPEGKTQEEFREYVAAFVEALRNVFISAMPGKFKGRDEKPLGVVIAGERNRVIEPHVTWFPWASARNRLEATVSWMGELREKGKLAIITVKRGSEAQRFQDRVCMYGVTRRVGTIEGYFDDGDDAAVYQTRKEG